MSSVPSRRRARRVYTFNIMAVGATGLGKTTFLRTLMSDTGFKYDTPNIQKSGPTLSIQVFSSVIDIGERSVSMSVIDTPGFGDKLDNSESCKGILGYVENQFKAFLEEEQKIQRNPKFLDPRVHVVLYFLDPTGHNLSELDIEFMRTLGRSTNIIPIIGRADSVSENELRIFKKKIIEQISKNNLQHYDFPIYSDDEEKFIIRNNHLEDLLPFAVVASEDFHATSDGRKIRGRKYPWGLIEVENPDHCDFNVLKEVLLRSHMEVLKEDTHEIHYEYFRKNELIKNGFKNQEQGHELKKVLSQKEVEEAGMKERKRRSRISFVPVPNF